MCHLSLQLSNMFDPNSMPSSDKTVVKRACNWAAFFYHTCTRGCLTFPKLTTGVGVCVSKLGHFECRWALLPQRGGEV